MESGPCSCSSWNTHRNTPTNVQKRTPGWKQEVVDEEVVDPEVELREARFAFGRKKSAREDLEAILLECWRGLGGLIVSIKRNSCRQALPSSNLID